MVKVNDVELRELTLTGVCTFSPRICSRITELLHSYNFYKQIFTNKLLQNVVTYEIDQLPIITFFSFTFLFLYNIMTYHCVRVLFVKIK